MTTTHNPNSIKSTPKTRPIPHARRTEAHELARTMAEQLGEPSRMAEFEAVCLTTSHDRIRSVLTRVCGVPEGRIRKSKVALFYYLLKHDAHEEK